MKTIQLLLLITFVFGCASRELQKDYKVVDSSHQEVPEWVADLDEWLDDEEDDFKDY